jgi:ribosomal protein L44E
MNIGDYVEDYCSRCKRTADHSVTAIVDDQPVKVLCRTCNNEHKYRGNRGKKELTAAEAFDKVLASVTGQLGGAAKTPKPGRKKKQS